MKRYSTLLAAAVLLALTAGIGSLGAQEQVKLEPVVKGASRLIGYYIPQRLKLTQAAPKSIVKAPPLKSPAYGIIPAKSDGGRAFHVILDESSATNATLYVDANGDGDLTNDAAVAWKAYKGSNGYSTWDGSATLSLASGTDSLNAQLGIYRFDPKDPTREAYRDSIFYYRDYAYSGKATIGGKSYTVALSDDTTGGNFTVRGTQLLIDRDDNGVFDSKWESFDITSPFNIDGQSYEVADMKPLGGVFTVKKSDTTVAELKAPADHSIGKTITSFTTTDMDGKTVNFPGDFAGKIVLLDFWATWCGPCVQEIPGLAAAYKKYGKKGFDVLGISLDSANQDKEIRSFMKGKNMLWREVYDGKGWEAEIAQLFMIESIPSSFLVDGDTGEILAKTERLRGTSLIPTLESALKKKGKL